MNTKQKTGVLAAVIAAVALGGMAVAQVSEEAGKRFKFRGGPDFATLDANGDGVFTKEEAQAHGAARFAATDTDGNGELTQAEIVAAVIDRASERAEKMATRMFEYKDANADGVLTADEMSSGDRMTRMFDRLDADGDGAISQEEMAAKKHRGGRHMKHDGDNNQDG
jgi:hypothetical protein